MFDNSYIYMKENVLNSFIRIENNIDIYMEYYFVLYTLFNASLI